MFAESISSRDASASSVASKMSASRSKRPVRKIDVQLISDALECENIYDDKFDLNGSQNSLNDIPNSEDINESMNLGKQRNERNRVTFISPRPISVEIPLDNMYDISDNGIEELSRAFITDFSCNPTSQDSVSFFERLNFLDSFLQEVQDECQPRSILKQDRAVSAGVESNRRNGIDEYDLSELRPFTAPNRNTFISNSRSRYLNINQEDDKNNKSEKYVKEPEVKIEPVVYSYHSGKQMRVFKQKNEDGRLTSFGMQFFIYFLLLLDC